jgi:tetratricopeptide (TPR) repeat protein
MAAGVLIFAGVVAYHNSFTGPFVFDDTWSIPLNPSIRQFGTALTPPNDNGQTVSGRPLLNLSFAVNYAISGKDVWSYHAGNLLIHIAAGLVLFGLVRRTLELPALRGRFGRHSVLLSFMIAALWMLHPLQTGSVTYIAQRAESMMALWYLLTLYCFAHGVVSVSKRSSTVWLGASVISCLFGMATKEVMVSAPLIVLLFDRAFVAGSMREAWTRRKAYYICLAATWILLASLAMHAGDRGNTAGFAGEVGVWTYLLTQAKALAIYMKLTVWPAGQIFDYGTATVADLSEVWMQTVAIAGLVFATPWLLVRRPMAGLAAFFVFAVLAPSSSFIPIWTEPMAEHRMYLPLAAIVTGAVAVSYQWLGRGHPLIWAGAWGAVALVLLTLTVRRNTVYKDMLTLWRDTVQKAPGSARANNNYANALVDDNFPAEAIKYCQRAMDLDPKFALAYNNYGHALSKLNRHDESLAYYDKALSFREHGLEIILANRGYSLYSLGRFDDAIMDFEAALKIRPDYEEALNNYGNVLHAAGRPGDALEYLDKALALSPKFASAWNNRGNIFSSGGLDREEALRCYKRAAELDPKLWEAQDNAGRYCMTLGRHAEAVPYLETAVPLASDEAIARYRLANALMLSDRQQESISQYQRVIELRPDIAGAYHNIAVALMNTGDAGKALPYFEVALRFTPDAAPVHASYADALSRVGRLDEAIARVQEALRLAPDFTAARELLARLMNQQRRQTAVSGADASAGPGVRPEFSNIN